MHASFSRFTVTRTAVLVVMAGALGACVMNERLQTPLLVAGSRVLQVFWVNAYPDPNGIQILGRVRRQEFYLGSIRGHLHIEGRFADNSAPVTVDTRWNVLPARGAKTAAFQALLKTDRPTEVVLVRVEHRLYDDDRAPAT